MRNALARFREEFPDDNIEIFVDIGNAIRKDDANALSQIISNYFSKTGTIGFLDGAIAAYWDDEEKVQLLPPAFLALEFKSRKALVEILRSTENPNARRNPDEPENSPTLLMRAVLYGDIEAAQLLLDAGANPNEEEVVLLEDGTSLPTTALSYAVSQGLNKTADLLLNEGAIPTFLDAHQALVTGDVSMLERIVSHHAGLIQERAGLSLRVPILSGATLLYLAVIGGNISTIKWLVGQGADVNAISDIGATPLDVAIGQGKNDVADYLRSAGGIRGAQESSSNIPEVEKMKQEITKNIERLELLEEKFGIAISGIYASCEATPWNRPTSDYIVSVNFDMASLNGGALGRSFKICASAYNSTGQLLGKLESYIDKEDFMGFASINITLYLDQAPEKVRLFPTV